MKFLALWNDQEYVNDVVHSVTCFVVGGGVSSILRTLLSVRCLFIFLSASRFGRCRGHWRGAVTGFGPVRTACKESVIKLVQGT